MSIGFRLYVDYLQIFQLFPSSTLSTYVELTSHSSNTKNVPTGLFVMY